MSRSLSDKSCSFSPIDDVKLECDGSFLEKSLGKRKLETSHLPIIKRFASIKKEFMEIKQENPTLRISAPLECACHDVIEIEVSTQLPKLSFKRSTGFAQQVSSNGIYFESEDVEPSSVLLIELVSKYGENDFRPLQNCDKCKDKRDGKEIITVNANNIISNSKGIISLSISLHEQSAHLDPSYTGGKIKDNMKLYIRASLFTVLDDSLQPLESTCSEGIKVVAQGKLKNRQVKQERQFAQIKQDSEKLVALVNNKQQASLVSELTVIRDRCTTLEDRNQLLEIKQEMLEKKTAFLEEKCLQIEELIKKFISPNLTEYLLNLNGIQTQSSPFINATATAEFLMATVDAFESSPDFDFILQNNLAE